MSLGPFGPLPTSTRHELGFWCVAFAFVTTMAFSTVPTPLYPIYQAHDGFSTFMITVIFAVYAVGVIAGLVFAGHVSDWAGRKRVLVPALLLEIIAAAMFLSTSSVEVLLGARLVNGVGVGMLTATATAYLFDLHKVSHPGASPRRFEVVSTASNIGGLGTGSLVSGVLAEYVAGPLRTPYIVFVILLILSVVAVLITPETIVRPASRPPYRPQRLRADYGDRRSYAAAAAAGFVSLAIFGVFTSVAPGFVAGELHHTSRSLAGLVVFAVFGSAALAQVFSSGIRQAIALRAGIAAQTIGLIALCSAMHTADLALFLAGGIITGVGAGVLFKGAIAAVSALAGPDNRGEALAGFFLVSYVGLSVPALSIGFAVRHISATTAMTGLTVILVVVLAGVGIFTPQHNDAR